MVGVARKQSKGSAVRSSRKIRSVDPLYLIQGSFSPRKVARQFPMIAAFHRAADGALIGVLITVGLMSGLTLHWQHLWTVAFSQLETTRDIVNRLSESTAMLERQLLKNTSLPMSMVPTKAANLLYLETPDNWRGFGKNNVDKMTLLQNFVHHPISHGY